MPTLYNILRALVIIVVLVYLVMLAFVKFITPSQVQIDKRVDITTKK